MAATARRLATILAAAAVGAGVAGCGALPAPMPAHEGAASSDPRAMATLAVAQYLYIRALDGAAVAFRLPPLTGLRTYALAPGPHRVWATSSGWPGAPLPTHLHCYSIDIRVEAGVRYLLREDEARRQLLLLREGSDRTEAVGMLVDRPLLPLRDCRWETPTDSADQPGR